VQLDDAIDEIFSRPGDLGVSLAMVVMIDGEIVAERYGVQPATPFGPATEVTPETTLISWSTAKSITHAAVGLLVADGLLDLSAPAPVPEWKGTDKAAITLLDLLEMRPGLRFVEDYVDGEVSHCLAMLFGEGADDMAAYAAGLPLDHAPGTVWNYSSGTTNIICRIIGDVIGGQHGVEQFLRSRLFEPAGMTSAEPRFDAAGTWIGSSYVYATARDFARFGELYRNDGLGVSGERVLPAGWADHARTWVAHDPEGAGRGGFDYGRHWWMWPELAGSVAAHGYEGQYVLVVPQQRITLVHLGKTDRVHQPALVASIADLIHSIQPRASAFGGESS
jgi:CubicO group peptidase (beta-lactamase class C family)